MLENSPEIIVITGPTGVGKTDLSIEVALKRGYEIISADSRQVYKYMNIGTSKIMPSEMKGVKHHLIDFLEPDDDYNAFLFAKDAKEIIKDNSSVMVVGGTLFYIEALFGDGLQAPKADENVRQELIKRYRASKEEVYEELKAKDLLASQKIHINDEYRVTRALSVIYSTGLSYSSFKNKKKFTSLKPRFFILNMEREKLYNQINQRVDKMVKEGLIDEVEDILKKGFDPSLKSLNTLGYKEVIEYLKGEISKEAAIYRIKKETRNFAKRQLTWLKSLNEQFRSKEEIFKELK